jgi:hypothetical protein
MHTSILPLSAKLWAFSGSILDQPEIICPSLTPVNFQETKSDRGSPEDVLLSDDDGVDDAIGDAP